MTSALLLSQRNRSEDPEELQNSRTELLDSTRSPPGFDTAMPETGTIGWKNVTFVNKNTTEASMTITMFFFICLEFRNVIYS